MSGSVYWIQQNADERLTMKTQNIRMSSDDQGQEFYIL